MKAFMNVLNKYKQRLTKQQYKTIRGQVMAGDLEGAYKGLFRLINKK